MKWILIIWLLGESPTPVVIGSYRDFFTCQEAADDWTGNEGDETRAACVRAGR